MGCSSSAPAAEPEPPGLPMAPTITGGGMILQFQCTGCKQQMQVPVAVARAGVGVQCPSCGTLNQVLPPPDLEPPPPPPPLPTSLPPRPDSSTRKMKSQMSTKFKEGEKTRALIEGCMSEITKTPCKYGLKCYRRKGEHLDQFYHPDDDQYALSLWKHSKIRGEFLTLQQCMKFMDPFDKGIVDDKELLCELLKHLKGDEAPSDDEVAEIWEKIDDDGNGYVSFAEFIEWATEYGLGLPVGLDDTGNNNGTSSRTSMVGLKCGFPGCTYGRNGQGCCDFKPGADPRICRCGHKRSVHTVQDSLTQIPVPEYWQSQNQGSSGNEWVDVSDKRDHFQCLMDASAKKCWTRDRGRGPDGKCLPVPSSFTVHSVKRNENLKIWRKYHLKKGLIQANLTKLGSDTEIEFKPYVVKTTQESVADNIAAIIGSPLDQECNEWLLWHGTSLEGAHQICDQDFKQKYAGSATGTLYGPGTYFAESCTKADEYAKLAEVDGDSVYTVLLCRVIGGLVMYTADLEPDAEALTAAVLHDNYDSVLGDREAAKSTFKEFVIFGSDQVYPEYIVHYTRNM